MKLLSPTSEDIQHLCQVFKPSGRYTYVYECIAAMLYPIVVELPDGDYKTKDITTRLRRNYKNGMYTCMLCPNNIEMGRLVKTITRWRRERLSKAMIMLNIPTRLVEGSSYIWRLDHTRLPDPRDIFHTKKGKHEESKRFCIQ